MDKDGGGFLAGALLLEVCGKGILRGNSAAVEKRHVSPYAISKDCFIGLLKNKTNQKRGREKKNQVMQSDLCTERVSVTLASRNPVHHYRHVQTLMGPRQLREVNAQLHHGKDNTRNLLPYGFKQKP